MSQTILETEPQPIFKTDSNTNKSYIAETVRIIDGKRQGRSRHYRPDGTPQMIADFKDDLLDGIVKEFHENGVTASRGRYIQDQRVGQHVFYDKTGKKTLEILYPDTLEEYVPMRPFLSKTYYDTKGDITLDLEYGEDWAVKNVTPEPT